MAEDNPEFNRIYDFSQQGWGHKLFSLDHHRSVTKLSWWEKLLGKRPIVKEYYSATGYVSVLPRPGSLLLIRLSNGKTGRFRIVKVWYRGDPKDHFKATEMIYEGNIEDGNLPLDLTEFLKVGGMISRRPNEILILRG